MLHGEKSIWNVALLAPGREEGALGTQRLQVHPSSSAAQNQQRGCRSQRDVSLPSGPKQISSPGTTVASCCAFNTPLWSFAGEGTLPRGISEARRPNVLVVIIPEEQTYWRGRFCTVAARAEDNGPWSDGGVKRDLFRCQGQKALPKSSVRKLRPQGEGEG